MGNSARQKVLIGLVGVVALGAAAVWYAQRGTVQADEQPTKPVVEKKLRELPEPDRPKTRRARGGKPADATQGTKKERPIAKRTPRPGKGRRKAPKKPTTKKVPKPQA